MRASRSFTFFLGLSLGLSGGETEERGEDWMRGSRHELKGKLTLVSSSFS